MKIVIDFNPETNACRVEIVGGSIQFGGPRHRPKGDENEEPGRDMSVREFVEQSLAAHPEGVKAAEIKAAFDQIFAVPLHDKTIGMSLYRMLRSGQARREGHVWFAA